MTAMKTALKFRLFQNIFKITVFQHFLYIWTNGNDHSSFVPRKAYDRIDQFPGKPKPAVGGIHKSVGYDNVISFKMKHNFPNSFVKIGSEIKAVVLPINFHFLNPFSIFLMKNGFSSKKLIFNLPDLILP